MRILDQNRFISYHILGGLTVKAVSLVNVSCMIIVAVYREEIVNGEP